MKNDLTRAYLFALNQLQTASSAFVHPIGFTMFQCVPDEEGGYRRLHIWNAMCQSKMFPHSHSSNLRSTILAGKLRNCIWEVLEDEDGPQDLIDVIKSDTNTRLYRKTSRVRCNILNSEDFRSGTNYVVRAGIFHTTEILEGVCVTIVDRQPNKISTAQITTPTNTPIASERNKKFMCKNELTIISNIIRS